MTMQHDQEMLKREIEAHMINASAQMELLERLDALTDDCRHAFIEGYIFRSQTIEALNEIYFGKEVIE